MTAAEHPTLAELRSIPQFADLPDDQLAWFAERCELREYAAGDVLFTEGHAAQTMFLIFSGELHGRARNAPPDARPYIVADGDVAGTLPFSRMTHWGGTGRIIRPARIGSFPASGFPEMMRRMPALTPRLVQVMADRVRENTRTDLQRDKLLALGRLSAGLAHELNNPASAARRAADGLRRALRDVWERTAPLVTTIGAASLERLAGCVDSLVPAGGESPLARSDRDEEVARWLEQRGMVDAHLWAPTFAESGADITWMGALESEVPPDALQAVLAWTEATLRARQLTGLVESAADRISALVGAVKSYTYMDRSGTQAEVDLHAGLESTLLMLAHKLRGVRVERDYAADLPHIRGNGGELNQLWTNLLDNAADAVAGKGHITITTRQQGAEVCVDIADSGRGIPPALQEQVWEPFFTTKPIGQGTGLGLDIVRRIVVAHGGHVRLRSEPGHTRVTVVLPIQHEGA